MLEGGGPTGVNEPADDGGGPAGVVEGFEAPNGLNAPFLRLSGVEGGLEENESGTPKVGMAQKQRALDDP
jgi:hypothetical protein